MANVKFWILSLILVNFLVEADSAICCLSYVRQPRRCGFLKGYDIQEITAGCDIPAIIFHTVKGKSICADPAEPWTQSRVTCLKMKADQMMVGMKSAI